jgi:hypothetical protein
MKNLLKMCGLDTPLYEHSGLLDHRRNIKMKDNYSALLIAAVMLLGVSQALDGMVTPIARFLNGVLIGLSIVCSVIGLVLYVRSTKKD